MVWAPLYGLGTFFTSCKSLVPLNLFSLWLRQKLYPQYDVKPSRQLSHKTIPARWAVLPTKVVRNLKYFGHGFTTTAPTCASGQHVMLSHCLLQPGEKRKADDRTKTSNSLLSLVWSRGNQLCKGALSIGASTFCKESYRNILFKHRVFSYPSPWIAALVIPVIFPEIDTERREPDKSELTVSSAFLDEKGRNA